MKTDLPDPWLPALRVLAVIGGCMLALEGCGESAPEIDSLGSILLPRPNALETVPALRATDGEDRSRYIGVMPGAEGESECPIPFGPENIWGTRHLFRIGDEPISSIPPALRPFCLYTRDQAPTGDGLPSGLEALLNGGRLKSVGPDHWVVSPSSTATSLGGVIGPELARAADEHMGRLPGIPAAGFGSLPVRIAVLDSKPTAPFPAHSVSHPGRSDHGLAMLSVIHNLVCNGSTFCGAELTSRLALPLHVVAGRVVEDATHGGYFGYIGGLARAIHEEVRDWQRAYPGGKARLVLNLSVGWPRIYGGDGVSAGFPPDVLAVYRALEVAHCEGAGLIVAAGNQTGGPSDIERPLYPGGWETHAAPNRLQCSTALGHAPSRPLRLPHDRYTPLLYAAGGIDALGARLSVSRPGGQPRIVAYADHVVAPTPSGGLTSPKTGTSSATAALSAVAGLVWYYDTNQSIHGAMNAAYQAGREVASRAEFCLNPPCGAIRRATVCEAVSAACQRPTKDHQCPLSGFASCGAWLRERLEFKPSAFDGFDDGADEHELDLTGVPDVDAVCRGEESLSRSRFADPCPRWQYHGANTTPYLGPQPPDDGCPNCSARTILSAVRLELSVDIEEYDSPTLTLIDSSGDAENYGLSELHASGPNVTIQLPTGTLNGVESVLFTGVRDGVAVNAPLLLVE
ncbi:MAG: S8/S53 family peptidase [Myxococcota bacterium]